MFDPHRRLAVAACGFLFFSTISIFATAPRLFSISPTGGQCGTELPLSFHGERLQDAEEIFCYEPGIEVKHLSSVTNQAVEAMIKIAPDCSLGEHHFRVRTASGISELRTFFVGPFPVVAEIEPNNLSAKAQPITLNTTISGVITNEDVDCFAVVARKGERLSAEVEGMRLGREMFDPRLSVLDTNGQVLMDVDDTWLATQDPFISFVAPYDGSYVFQLREATYGGGAECHYRLHVGNFARPTSVFPPGGKTGDLVSLTFYSEATGEFVQKFQLPKIAQEKYGVIAERDGLPAPSPNWIRVSPFPNVLSTGQTPDREHATMVPLQPPFALNGIITRKGQEDWFQFPATKGVPLDVNVYARQLRSPLDSVVDVYDDKGRHLIANDDNGGADSALKFTPAETGNYFIRIRDTLDRFGRDYTYRIEIVPAAPAITVKIPEVARNDTQSRQFIAVPRGNRFATLISVKRVNVPGETKFEVPGLPAGIVLSADDLPLGVDAEPLVFTAAADAPVGGALLDLNAVGTNASGRIIGHFRQDIELVSGPPNQTTYYGTHVDKICMAVVKEASFHVRIVEPKADLVQGGSMALEVVVERQVGFNEPIELQMVWNPPGVTSQTEATIPPGATNVTYQLNAGEGAELHSWKIAVLAHALVEGGQTYVSSQLAKLEIASPFVAGKILPLVANPGKTASLTVELEQLKPFEGSAKIRLLGLPDKVTAPEMSITKDDKKISFDIVVDSKCPPGSSRNLFCAVDVPKGNSLIPHDIATGGILRIVPAKSEPLKAAKAKEPIK